MWLITIYPNFGPNLQWVKELLLLVLCPLIYMSQNDHDSPFNKPIIWKTWQNQVGNMTSRGGLCSFPLMEYVRIPLRPNLGLKIRLFMIKLWMTIGHIFIGLWPYHNISKLWSQSSSYYELLLLLLCHLIYTSQNGHDTPFIPIFHRHEKMGLRIWHQEMEFAPFHLRSIWEFP